MEKEMNLVTLPLDGIHPYVNNPRKNDGAVKDVEECIRQCGYNSPIVVDENHVILAGHTRLKALLKLGRTEAQVVVREGLSDEQKRLYRIADNKTAEASEWDFEKLELELDGLDLGKFDFTFELEEHGISDLRSRYNNKNEGALSEAFIVPPFSVLDCRSGPWRDRKQCWQQIIQDGGKARSSMKRGCLRAITSDNHAEISLLDPVLCEVICKWFLPLESGSSCFDVFAGDTAFGFVSAYKGSKFTGIELREEQAEFNNDRTAEYGLNARYICDDGRNVLNHIGQETQDLLFSCPPYYDLEVYSDKPNDASNQKTYEDFLKIIDEAFTNAAKCLKNNRFAVVVCGDIRNRRTGTYYGFPDDIKQIFRRAGMPLYNEIIKLDPCVSAGIRASGNMRTRKVVKVHQNVLVFYKGNVKDIQNHFGDLRENYEEFMDGSEDE